MAITSSESPFPGWVAAYQDCLYAWVRARVGSGLRRLCDPEDVLQEVWTRAAECLPARPVEFPRAWLFAIAANVLREELRGSLREARHVTRHGDTALVEVVSLATSATRVAVRGEVQSAFYAELDRLDEDDRELFVMHLLEGRPLAEAAVRLGIRTAAASKRVQRLRARLARHGSLARYLA